MPDNAMIFHSVLLSFSLVKMYPLSLAIYLLAYFYCKGELLIWSPKDQNIDKFNPQNILFSRLISQ